MKALLLGDVSPTSRTGPLFRNRDKKRLFGDTSVLFEGNDINFVNLECALTESEHEIPKIGPALKAPIETAEVLRDLGVTVCGLSNNHIFDYGKEGLRDTLEALDRANISYTGFGDNAEDARRSLIFEKDGERVAIVAVCEREYTYALEDRMGARLYDPYDTLDDIRDLKKETDRIIVIYHGGKEFCRVPSPRLRKLCHAMAKCGADVILCQHSHCIGCYEHYEGCHILYGQGNFHFVRNTEQIPRNSDFWSWNTSLAVSYDTKTDELAFFPLIANESVDGICFPNKKTSAKIMEDFQARSEMLLDGRWREEWHAFCESVRNSYTKRTYNEFKTDHEKEIFAHFLDCEAHTDVWREIFPTLNLTNEK